MHYFRQGFFKQPYFYATYLSAIWLVNRFIDVFTFVANVVRTKVFRTER